MRRTLLGLDHGVEEEPAPEESLPDGSLLGLRGASGRAAGPAAPRPADPGPTLPVPEETDLFQIERKSDRAFPIERAILFSLAAHVLFFLVVLSSPRWLSPAALSHARKGLLGAFIPEESPQQKIPIVFRAAPGPARENPRRSDPSNLTRRAGGGDPSRPKADTPYIPPKPGIEGLAEGAAGRPRPGGLRPPESGASGAPRPNSPPGASGEKQAAAPDAFRVPAPGSGQAGREETRLAGLDRAIQQAARDEIQRRGAGGENGAGFPNPDGGFVDTGGVSFDTSWYDWGDYADAMVRRIKLHWHPPMDLMYLGAKGKVSIRFFIMADGAVAGVQLLRPSDHPPFTSAAMQAILTSNPFRPLPKDLLRMVPGKDREGIVVTFFYNMRPGKEGEESAR